MLKNKRIFITGCYGFVAQHLIFKLLENNNTVTGIFNKKYQKQIFDVNKYIKNKKYKIIKGDITNNKFLNNLIKYNKFDFCYHLAAISQVLNSNAFPEITYKVNIFGTINLLESFRKYQPKTHFIFSSSDKVYGDSQKLPYSENSPLNALNFYDSSKASADIICRTYANSFKMKIIVTRFVNIYGPGDVNWDRIIPGTIKYLIKNKKPILRSNGNFIRDYIYIDDVISGYIVLSKKMLSNTRTINGRAMNFGSNKPIKAITLVKKILKIYNKNSNFFIIKNKVNNEIKDQYSDYKLAKKLIGWKPKIDLDTGLKKTISWYNKNIRK